jgi:glycosidase
LKFLGFTSVDSSKPWLPINENYKELNLAKQKEAPNSPYQVYKFLTAARKELPAVQKGKLITTALSDNILVLNRFRITINFKWLVIWTDNLNF